jgi:hypothetical protein
MVLKAVWRDKALETAWTPRRGRRARLLGLFGCLDAFKTVGSGSDCLMVSRKRLFLYCLWFLRNHC